MIFTSEKEAGFVLKTLSSFIIIDSEAYAQEIDKVKLPTIKKF
jgi:RNA recognition motif-containing protein